MTPNDILEIVARELYVTCVDGGGITTTFDRRRKWYRRGDKAEPLSDATKQVYRRHARRLIDEIGKSELYIMEVLKHG